VCLLWGNWAPAAALVECDACKWARSETTWLQLLVLEHCVYILYAYLQVSLVLPSVQDGLGAGGAYALFGVVSVLALASIYWTVPETKGKSLEEIEKMLDRGEMQ
jgi:Sugar (and other) transporter